LALAVEGPFVSVRVKAMEVLWNGKGVVFMNGAVIVNFVFFPRWQDSGQP
jgi:hypothetical protein